MVGRGWRNGLVGVITGVWVVQFVAMLWLKFEPDPTVNALMLLVAGSIFGAEAIKHGRGGSE